MPRRPITLAIVLVVGILATSASASAAILNFAVIRGEVVANYPDCSTCSLTQPHGCYTVVNAPDPVTVHLPVQANGDDCNDLIEGDCIELNGTVVDMFVSSWPVTVERIQVDASSWVRAANLCSD